MTVCKKCGSIDDFRTEKSGPHIKAICNSCNSYIKFLPQEVTDETIMYFGKYKDHPVKNIPLSYWLFMLEKDALKGSLKSYAQQLIYAAK